MCETWHIREAVRRIAAGGIIAYPTETIYGLGCDPFSGASVLRLLALKQRDIAQGLILIASRFDQVDPLLLPLAANVRKRVCHASMPPVSWLLPCAPDVPCWLRGEHASLVIRITAHPVAAALCNRWGGPLVSTSANVHGRPPATGPLAVHKAFHGRLEYVLHDSGPASHRASEIRDGITDTVLRPG